MKKQKRVAEGPPHVWMESPDDKGIHHVVPVSGTLIQPDGLIITLGLAPRRDAQRKKWTGYALVPEDIKYSKKMNTDILFGALGPDEYLSSLSGKPHIKDRHDRTWTWDQVQEVLSSVPILKLGLVEMMRQAEQRNQKRNEEQS